MLLQSSDSRVCVCVCVCAWYRITNRIICAAVRLKAETPVGIARLVVLATGQKLGAAVKTCNSSWALNVLMQKKILSIFVLYTYVFRLPSLGCDALYFYRRVSAHHRKPVSTCVAKYALFPENGSSRFLRNFWIGLHDVTFQKIPALIFSTVTTSELKWNVFRLLVC